MKSLFLPVLVGLLGSSFLGAQEVVTAPPAPGSEVFEPSPILDAAAILQPAYDRGPFFQVRGPVPTYGGSNVYEIDSPLGSFDANGNAMLMRRVAEINAMAVLDTISKTDEFKQAALTAAKSPLLAAKELITHPVGTISGVPQGVWKFLNRTGQTVKELGEGRKPSAAEGNLAQNLIGFSKVKRQIALDLGVDPYSSNADFQAALNQVAWPAYAGGLTVNLGVAVATAGIGTAGMALSAVNWSGNLNQILRESSPQDLRLMNLGKLLDMGIDRAEAVAFLNNSAISPTTQTVLVSSLNLLTQAAGRDIFLQQAATAEDEHDALFFQQSAQLMARVNVADPITGITLLNGLPVCVTAGGAVVVPLQWDYMAWTPMAAQFADQVKAMNFPRPPTGYNLLITGDISPMAEAALTARGIVFAEKQLPGPLR
jgi:hypothetical protein